MAKTSTTLALRASTGKDVTVVDTADVSSWPLDRLVSVMRQLKATTATVAQQLEMRVAAAQTPLLKEAKTLLRRPYSTKVATPSNETAASKKIGRPAGTGLHKKIFDQLMGTDFLATARSVKDISAALEKLGDKSPGGTYLYYILAGMISAKILKRVGNKGSYTFMFAKKPTTKLAKWSE